MRAYLLWKRRVASYTEGTLSFSWQALIDVVVVVVNSLDRFRKGEADSFQCGTVGKDDGGSNSPEDGLSVRLFSPCFYLQR